MFKRLLYDSFDQCDDVLLIPLVSEFVGPVVASRLRLRRQGSLFPAGNLLELGMLQ